MLLVLVVVFIAGLVGLTPVALSAIGGDETTWERLSLIGQTYGAASALLSALALVGIAVTLVLQARDTKVSRDQGQRILHVDLLKMAMENPLYRRCWGPIDYATDAETELQHIYVNLIFSEWQTSFEIKTMDERLLRAVAANLFRGEVGRRFWSNARETRIATSSTRRERRFHQIVDEEYLTAEAQGPPISQRDTHPLGGVRSPDTGLRFSEPCSASEPSSPLSVSSSGSIEARPDHAPPDGSVTAGRCVRSRPAIVRCCRRVDSSPAPHLPPTSTLAVVLTGGFLHVLGGPEEIPDAP